MQTSTITEKVCLEPKYLNFNLKENIKKKLIQQIKGKCSQDYGYIINVNDNMRILSNNVSTTNSNVFFTVSVSIETLKPILKEEYKATINLILEQGIFVNINNLCKAFITKSKI